MFKTMIPYVLSAVPRCIKLAYQEQVMHISFFTLVYCAQEPALVIERKQNPVYRPMSLSI